jgi:hypothetical protein
MIYNVRVQKTYLPPLEMELKTEVREENTEKLDIVKIKVSKSKDTSKKIKSTEWKKNFFTSYFE